MEVDMAETEDKYKAIVETSLDGIYQVDRSGTFMFINESFANLFGYQREELGAWVTSNP
jgi:PAS domain S-box-containing protein